MSPLGLFGSLVAGRLYSRRICGQALGSAGRLLNQSVRHKSPSPSLRVFNGVSSLMQRTLASAASGSDFPGRFAMAESLRRVVTVGALSLLGGGVLYLKEDPEEPVARKLIRQEALEEETFEEKAMKKRFEEWMIKYGRRYRDEEEKAMRYKIFKSKAEMYDMLNSRPGTLCTFGTNQFSDRTPEERPCCYAQHPGSDKE